MVSKLLHEIKINVPGSSRELNFQSTEDVRRWLDAEEPFWTALDNKAMNPRIKQIWDQQRRFYESVRGFLRQYEASLGKDQQQSINFNQGMQNTFQQVSAGLIITSDKDVYPLIVNMSKVNLDVAGLLYVASREDAQRTLGYFSSLNIPFETLLSLIVFHANSEGANDWLSPQREEVSSLKNEYQAHLNIIRENVEEQQQFVRDQQQYAEQMHEKRASEWDGVKEKMESEWESLKKVYDEKLALLAPTKYWGQRARIHRNVSVAFAVAFGLTLAISVGLFAWLAMPHMFAVAGNREVSPLLTLFPIAIPAFAGVWVLRMLGRLLSENLQMMRDARERETMVLTFLALMRDDKSGDPIVNDNDRILILHSLFRPSSVAAIDDAPPVHWFDILTNKVGSKDAKR